MDILIAVLSGLVLAVAAPWLTRFTGDYTGWILAILPAGLTVYFISYLEQVAQGTPVEVAYPWFPGLNVELSFYMDGLSLFFAILITGIGTLIFIYAGGYLGRHKHLGRFFGYLSCFMAAMVGLVVANNLVTFYIFFELTSFASFMLIGFKHESGDSRRAAWQALLVTKLGGLAMLAGFILIYQVTGTMTISEIITQAEVIQQIQESHLYLPILLLILAGAFTKSAQFPFYFWLPNAMQAPTPVSAYLHSATMVKAGIFLMARFHPALGGTEAWLYIVTGFGAATMVISAWLALQYTDIKSILAYTTVMALGLLTMLLGIGSELAIKACMLFVLVHAFYKAALFMVAGAVDHGVHERDITKLGGLRHKMPITAAAAAIAGLSMAGIPPFMGFVGKEVVYEAALGFEEVAVLMAGVALLANVALVASAIILGYRPFYGKITETAEKAHPAPPSLWVGPVILAFLSVILGALPWLLAPSFITPATTSILGEPVELTVALWHGFNIELLLSAITVATGVGLYFIWGPMRNSRPGKIFEATLGTGLDNGYDHTVDGILRFGRWLTRSTQTGYLRHYFMIIAGVFVLLGATALIRYELMGVPLNFDDILLYEWVLAFLILGGALGTILLKSRLAAVAALGIAGFAIALLYLDFGAPDLAMTQFLVETLTVILFVLVLITLPRFQTHESGGSKLRDAAIAGGVGFVVTIVMLAILQNPFESEMAEYYAVNTYIEAEGRNIVNTILVDFRVLDTLGEIAVLLIAAFGIYSLVVMRNVSHPKERPIDDPAQTEENA